MSKDKTRRTYRMRTGLLTLLGVLLAAAVTACEGAPGSDEEKAPSEAASREEAEAITEDLTENDTEPFTEDLAAYGAEAVTGGLAAHGTEPATEDLTENGTEPFAEDPAARGEDGSEDETEDEIPGSGDGERTARLPLPYPTEELPERATHMAALSWELEEMISTYDGDWSVYALDLTTGEELCINDVPLPSASLMKLFVMGTVYQAIQDGELERTSEVVSLMGSMISVSSNGDTNRLLGLLGDGSYAAGIEKVNAYIHSHGYSEGTHEYNGFQDSATIVDPTHRNVVTARDCGLLLERVYHRTFGPRSVCNEVEDWMLHQATRYKIPRGIGEDVPVGNKSGETDDTENDAAVVYAKSGDFILVVLSSGWPGKDAAQKHIQDIARKTYLFLQGTEEEQPFIPLPSALSLMHGAH